eukprot:gnl/TRDRNA2_/TRDRNA2_179760_c0_seq1.p1 gnl/TRDRNA2_/TRDRNA2_179760_c0~~gnl/TRDRNA2_/TRDRNA2_179760_c0_seq1.p1  ORF type:complete len:1195 (+),score=248.56 gnl/TRDRNA2_/TRDRNA2_179760_c0_seq1:68-3652(+)
MSAQRTISSKAASRGGSCAALVVFAVLALTLSGCNEGADDGKKAATGAKKEALEKNVPFDPDQHAKEGPVSNKQQQHMKTMIITEQPSSDLRSYQFSVLPNGLQVVNVRDTDAKKVAVSVAVQAGSFDDPAEFPGLAHFCEHMLFLGTEHYPDSKGFDNFVSSNAGYNNAYTASEATVYYVELSQSATDEAYSRFSDFFRAPLFDKKYVEKEVNAINSEHGKNVQSPIHRIYSVMNSRAKTGSPVGKFSTGDLQTLYSDPMKDNKNPVDALKVWYKDHYCPSKFRLVTFGPESLEEQLNRSYVMFGDIPAGNEVCKGPRKSWAEPVPFPKENMGKWMHVEGTTPDASLMVHWPMPDTTKDWKAQPSTYVDYIFGYNGVDSLTRVLQDSLGLTTGLATNFDSNSAGGNLFMMFELTPRGRQHPELILDVVYEYIADVRRQGVNSKLHDSLADVSKLMWNWTELASPADTVSTLSEALMRIPAEHLLSGDDLIREADVPLLESLFALMTPDNMNVAFIDPSPDLDKKKVEILPHYNISHSVSDLHVVFPGRVETWSAWLKETELERVNSSDWSAWVGPHELRQKLQKAGIVVDPDATLAPIAPKPIVGVPKEIPTTYMHAEKKVPMLSEGETRIFGPLPVLMKLPKGESLSQEDDSLAPQAWYRAGWVTTSPKVSMSITLNIPRQQSEWEVSALDSLRLSMYNSLLSEEMTPKLADLSMTGSSYSVSLGMSSISFSFKGFGPAIPQLIEKVLEEMNKGVNVTHSARYERLYEQFNESFRTFSDMPVSYALKDRNLLLTPGSHSRDEQLDALGHLTKELAANCTEDLIFSRPFQLTSLAMGNLGSDEAKMSVAKIRDGVQVPKGVEVGAAEGEVQRITPVVKPSKPIEVRKQNPRPGDKNYVTAVSFLAGVADVESRVILSILGQILDPVAYNRLRTDMQLGYVVSAGVSILSNVQYMTAVVQGLVMDADETEAAIEGVFTNLMPKRLQDLTQDEFNSFKGSFGEGLLERPTGPSDEFDHFSSPVAQGGVCFSMREEMLRYLNESLTSKQKLIDTYNRIMFPKHGERHKLVVKYFAGDVPKRPSMAETEKHLQKYNVSRNAIAMMRKEHKKTLVFDKADSTVRAQIAKAGGYYPQKLICTRKHVTQSNPPAVLHVHQAREEEEVARISAPTAFLQRRETSSSSKRAGWLSQSMLSPN